MAAVVQRPRSRASTGSRRGARRSRRADPLARSGRPPRRSGRSGSALLRRGRRLGVLEAEGDHGDVVAAAGLVRLARPGSRRRRRGSRHRAEDGRDPSSLTIVVSPSEQSRKTSPGRALKVSVSTSTSRLGAQRPGDDRALRVVLGLLVGEPALAAQLLDQRVVGGQQPQLAVAPQVGAAVADVGEARPRRPRRSPRSASSPCPSGSSRAWARPWMRSLAVLGDRAQVGLRRLLAALARARTTRRRSARRPRPPARRPSRRRPRTAARAAK